MAVLFGREDDGLPSDALDRAQLAVTIPTTEHVSLNVAQAVLVALYELHLAAGDATRPVGRSRKHAGAGGGRGHGAVLPRRRARARRRSTSSRPATPST